MDRTLYRRPRLPAGAAVSSRRRRPPKSRRTSSVRSGFHTASAPGLHTRSGPTRTSVSPRSATGTASSPHSTRPTSSTAGAVHAVSPAGASGASRKCSVSGPANTTAARRDTWAASTQSGSEACGKVTATPLSPKSTSIRVGSTSAGATSATSRRSAS